ncbi:GNAT family N-acetyltransferase [Litorisediminicola beolgyonensis]|uniref:GNAT family N-acetyltransferase n=1 Tax=Litorisediminicola beolgyonensis TaxID=1173614 RepID=A0ABW3ZP24_9RHOB
MTAPVEKHRPGRAARAAAKIGSGVPVLDTRRTQIRAPRIYDFDAYATILGSERAAFMGGPYTREEAWADFTQTTALWLLHGYGLFTIDAATTPTAGFVRLSFEYGDAEPELGIMLTEGAEGNGYAEEAVRAVLAHLKDTLGWDTVVSYADPDNTRLSGLMDRLGASRDAEAEARLAGIAVWRFALSDAGGAETEVPA